MSHVSHISCPACKGAVGFTPSDRIITCSFCEAALLVEADNFIPEYYAVPSFDKEQARRSLQHFLMNSALPDGVLKNSRFKTAVLCYIPYHEVRSKRIGTIETEKRLSSYNSSSTRVSLFDSRDTAVVTGDIHRIEPAITVEDLGIDDTFVFEGLKNNSIKLSQFDRVKVARTARIYQPSIDAKKIMMQLNIKGFTAQTSDDTEFVESRIRRIFYPVWRLQYEFSGRVYFAVIDGLNGKTLFAKAPQGDKQRVRWLVAGVSVSGFIFGKLLKAMHFTDHLTLTLSTGEDKTGAVGLGVMLIVFLGILLSIVWFIVWNQFRYAGDIVHEKNILFVEKQGGFFAKSKRVPLMTVRDFIMSFIKKD